MPLRFETYPGATEPVLAIHGVSSQRKLWLWLHEAAPEITLLAPDLRGRGDSRELGGPYGMAAHVADLVALLDAADLESVHVLGMSMGGFVAVHLAAAQPERVRSLILVDGGPPMAVPLGLTPELVPAAFAGRVGRLARIWDSVEEYRDYVCGDVGPLLDPADPLLLANLSHDLDAAGRVRLDGDALIEDATDIYFGANPWEAVTAPTRMIRAEWGVGADSPPAYGPAELQRVLARGVDVVTIPGVDHAGTVMGHHGAAVVADVLRRAVA